LGGRQGVFLWGAWFTFQDQGVLSLTQEGIPGLALREMLAVFLAIQQVNISLRTGKKMARFGWAF